MPVLLERLSRPEGLHVRFQPIVEIDAGLLRPHAVECLARGPAGSTIEAAPILFDYVRNKHAEALVDRLCVTRGIQGFGGGGAEVAGALNLHLNVHCVTLARDRDFVSFLFEIARAGGVASSGLTVELLEYRAFSGSRNLRRAIDAIHEGGARIALDDIGHADSNLRMLLESQADYFKIDGHFIRGVHADIYRRALVQSLVELAPRFGAWVVAEGVESLEDLQAVTALGVTFVQGYLVARPVVAEEIAHQLAPGRWTDLLVNENGAPGTGAVWGEGGDRA